MENELTINVSECDKVEECLELKNIKYKTMLMNGVQVCETKSSNNISMLDQFLEDEKNNSKVESWTKLNKTLKTEKLIHFSEKYTKENSLNQEEENLLIDFFKDCLDKKKLNRIKDVIYDKELGTIKEVPSLVYVKSTKKFTLKNMDKRVSTLKSLPPKKMGTAKNHQIVADDS